MHRLTRHFIHLLFVAAVCLGIGLPAQAMTFAFKHSPNAKRLQDKHIQDLRGLLGEYKKMVSDAGDRFEIASRRHIQRYSIALQREVRSLTRDGKIDAAFAVQAKVDESKKWKIYPPNFEGVHFLDKIDLTVEGSEAAAKEAVDLSVEVEKLGQLYAKQVDLAFERYKENVAKTRASYIEALERVLTSEQSAGRLDAVKEVMAAVKAIKELPPVEQPGKPRVVENNNPTRPSGNNDNEPDHNHGHEDEPERDPTRPNIFEGVHGDDEHEGTDKPPVIDIDVENEGDTPRWAGYYVIKYSINGRHGVRYVVKLDDEGSTVLFSSRDSKGNDRELQHIPIKITELDSSGIVFKHESDTQVKGTIVHRLSFSDGKPAKGRVWWSEFGFDRNDEPAQTGEVYRLGSPEADLLGLANGVYIAEMAQVKSKSNKPEFKTIQFEVTVDDGNIMISRDHRGTARGWSDFHAFMLNVETVGDDLVMNYDRDEFSWPDTFIIDMSDPEAPVLKHWWRGDWRTRGDEPSASGPLKPKR